MKKRFTAATLLMSAALVLSGCSTGSSSSSNDSSSNNNIKTLNFVESQELPTADLSLATDTVSFTVLNNVYEGLYRQDKDNQLALAGASEKPEVSQDGLTYKFKLRQDAKWSNGDPVTAKDYVYSWQRTVEPETASQYAYLFEPVANAADITAGKKDKSELGIKAVGDYELEITLNQATPYFERLLAFPSFFPQNQAVAEKFGKDYTTKSANSVYNGPFVLDGFDGPGTDTTWTYAKNDQYWDKDNVKVNTINVNVVKESATSLNLFNDGQADNIVLTGELAQQNRNNPQFKALEDARTSYLEYNQRDQNSKFRNENLRKAIGYSIDRTALANAILGDGSLPSTSLVPKGTMTSPDGKDFAEAVNAGISFDAAKAKEHWEKAKQELGITSLDFSILASDSDSSKKVIEYLQSAIQSNLDGVKVTLNPVPFSVRLDRSKSGNFDVVLGGWGADYLDASSFTDLLVTGNSYNRGQWSNSEYDELIKASKITDVNDATKRFEDLINADRLLSNTQGITPLYQGVEAHMVNSRVKNFVSHPAGAKFDYKWIEVQ
ncbi:peptide ABC transporter substrate-binding protein [Holzapfeliella sp. He02]|uniref:Peptide ABC transporter substrate-binding protein n=1 Tax=Holzapfeliella saturejae TaxID=3082953 RepID=A0ABU8SG82_9LACO